MRVRALTTAVITALLLIAVPGVADATPRITPWTCGDSAMCIYSSTDGTGHYLSLRDGVYDLSGVGGGVLANNVHAARNISGRNWCLYSSKGYEDRITLITDGFKGAIGDATARQVKSVGKC
ncbi:peptidase inhibitor family I36 protein [Kitasatospora sp. NPDC004799]|uniref:peptidase inhibitor family I36 protein n=1 Tax=Kitasatospora sp. NPDC004799 TaxID=3154460 RepID=UPI0033A55D21